jgi:phosphatidylglycerophosphatase A
MGHKSNQLLADRVAALPHPTTTWQKWIVTGGGVGFLRPAPGSWGTCPPALFYFLMLLAGWDITRRSLALLGFGMIAGGLLIAYGKWAAAYFREPDPGSVILDEYAGFALTIAFVPVPDWFTTHAAWGLFLWTSLLYILFRATDTLKLPPANYLERLPWGWGVLFDDLAAGIQANILAQIFVLILQHYTR